MNFGLCRILIATVNGNISPGTFVTPPNFMDTYWDAITLNLYQNYVHANVFAPSGVTDPTLVHATDDALAYNFPVSGNGWNSGDVTTMAGGAGWHMTVDDVLNVMGTFRRAGTIVSQEQPQTMLDSNFGIDFATSTLLGTLYANNGGWQDNAGHVEQSVLFYVPEDIELVVLVNSPTARRPSPCSQSCTTRHGQHRAEATPAARGLKRPAPCGEPLGRFRATSAVPARGFEPRTKGLKGLREPIPGRKSGLSEFIYASPAVGVGSADHSSYSAVAR